MKHFKYLVPVPDKGFSLVELSIVMVVVGVLLAALIPIGTGQNNVRQYELTKNRLDIIQKALNTHIKLKGGLPCPASKTALPDTAGFGVATDCVAAAAAGTLQIGANPNYVRIGAVPVRTLNLPEAMMFDAWGRRFTYAVTRAATGTSLSGVISIIDANNNSVITSAGSAAYAVFSSGREGKGTHSRHGGATASCGTTTKDSENCDNDITFRDMAVNDGSDAANFFDDVIIWRTPTMIEDETGSLGSGGSDSGGNKGLIINIAGEDWANFRGVFLQKPSAWVSCSPLVCAHYTFDPENTRRECVTDPEYGDHCGEFLVPDDVNLLEIVGAGKLLLYPGFVYTEDVVLDPVGGFDVFLLRVPPEDRRIRVDGIMKIRFLE